MADADGVPIDLTGYTGTSQIRKHYSSSNSVSFTVQFNDTSGEVILSLTPDQTNNMTPGRYVYDVEVVDSANIISRIVEGMVTITPSVTR